MFTQSVKQSTFENKKDEWGIMSLYSLTRTYEALIFKSLNLIASEWRVNDLYSIMEAKRGSLVCCQGTV